MKYSHFSNQRGFVYVYVVIFLAVLIGAGYVILNPNVQSGEGALSSFFSLFSPAQPAGSPAPSPVSTTTPDTTPRPTNPSQKPAPTTSLSVADLMAAKDAYAGKTVQVRGKIQALVLMEAIACPAEGPCDTSKSGGVNLIDEVRLPQGPWNVIDVLKNGQQYPCTKTGVAMYSCPPFKDGEITTVSGIWVKERVATGWTGSSNGQPPTPISWGYRYYLEVK